MSDPNPLLALKHAWNGAIAASDRVRDLAPQVEALPADRPIGELDLEVYRQAAMAQASAVMALQGLVEQLQRQREAEGA